MKKISIYIDSANGGKERFTIDLVNRLKSLHGKGVSITTYNDIAPDTHNEDEWENITIHAIENSDIVFTLLTAEYLDFMTARVENSINKVIDSNDRFLFPILLSSSDWSSFNWVVKSNLIPENTDLAISECSEKEVGKILDGIIKNVAEIVADNVPKLLPVATSGCMNNSIFISHAHDDADFAELLKLRLEKHNINSWLDVERLKIGQDWREEIDLGIEEATAVIVIMSPDARKSEYVTYEWAFAWGRGVEIFPIMLKQTPLHPRLESLQYLDFTNRTVRPWDELISNIQNLIKHKK